MTDYKELANRLRERSAFMFPHYGEQANCDADLMNLAADAIEVLQARLLMAETERGAESEKRKEQRQP